MKRKGLIALITLVITLFVLAVFNTLQFYFLGKDLKQSVDETYFKPSINSALSDLQGPRNYPVESDAVNAKELIEENSVWHSEFTDLTLIREDWHFKLYDFIKNKTPEKADQVLKRYFSIKNAEIEKLNKIEDEFRSQTESFLQENNNVKDSKYYRVYHSAIQEKKDKISKVREESRAEKIDLFGRYYPEILKTNEDFQKNLNQRLSTEFSLKSEEINDIKRKSLKDGDELIYLSL